MAIALGIRTSSSSSILLVAALVFAGCGPSDPILAKIDSLGGKIERLQDPNLDVANSIVMVDFKGTRVRDEDLGFLTDLKRLQRILISHTRIGDAGVATFQAFTTLVDLDIHATLVTNDGLQALKGLAKLEKLNLHDTEIGDAGVSHLLELSNLQWLDIHGTQVTDASLESLGKLPALRDLDVRATAVTDQGLRALRALAPALSIASGPMPE